MTCRSLMLLSGLLLVALATEVAHSQEPPRRQSLADRIRGWGRDEEPPAEEAVAPQSAARQTGKPQQAGEPAPARRGFPQIDARSLLPARLFGRDDKQATVVEPPAPASGRNLQVVPLQKSPPRPSAGGQSTLRQSQSAAIANAPLRTAARPRAGAAPQASRLQDGFTLPGLGGSPLPRGAIGPPGNQPRVAQSPQASDLDSTDRDDGNGAAGAATKGADVSRDATRSYPLIQPNGRVDATAPPISLNPATGSGSGTATRQSPYQRMPMHVDADELRRELAGAFPAAPQNDITPPTSANAPAAIASEPEIAESEATDSSEIAPADSTIAPIVPNAPAPTNEPVAEPLPNEPAPSPSNSTQPEPTVEPVTLPVVEAPASKMLMLNINPPASHGNEAGIQFEQRDALQADTPTRREGAAAFGAERNIKDTELNFGFPAPRTSPRSSTTPTPAQPATTAPTSIQPATATPSTARRREVFGAAGQPATTDPNVLASHQTPLITTDIRGPKQILIGREATYRVRLQNQGQISAEGIIAHIRIPSGADVVDTATTHGTIQQAREPQTSSGLEWQLARLEAGASETLDVRLVPRSSRPLELGVSWTLAPIGSRAVVEVQEPKLRLHVSGPDEVLFGKPQLYRLTLTNPGTGMAENVKIDLLPPGGGDDAITSHPVGDLPAGTSQSIEVELTAREAGKLYVKAIASAEGGLNSDASKEIFCRKPELEVDWRGPETKYTGTEATHFFRVRNPGTAAAENVTVTVALPEGAELVSASEGQAFNAERREVAWRVGSLGPGDDFYMELKCIVNAPGRNQMNITAATEAGDLVDNSVAETNVIALADLKLEVSDPQGPIAVGDEAVYEIRIQNRGASAAQAVNVVALFSDGVEPDTIEGAMYSVADGRVSFRTIEALPAGKQVVLRIRAHAQHAGNHIFRAEVLCRELDIKLAAEETTRFYADEVFDSGEDTMQAEQHQPQPQAQPAVEVGDRYQTTPK